MEKTNTPAPGDPSHDIQEILLEARKIKQELQVLNAHKMVQATNSIPGLLYFLFLKGIAFGLGTVIGATIVVSLLAYLLSPFELVPVIGDWISRIVAEVQK